MLLGDLPIVVYLALLSLVVLLVVRYRGMMRGATRLVTRLVWCPIEDRNVTATLEEEFWDGRRVDVCQCSVFAPGSAVSCGKACLRVTERPRPAAASGIPLLF